ncbi:6-phosphogluconolactonase [Manganibacter manganicus]|uniref:6-phosphogluconolactonase n=1 Tax=Manganibacter manganicus TaxID=1873176 RepID=A0A1V8RQ43_9HYPH|nr:6-phosphogluconolactonase [Pseudaminobacter manganicus]OQM75253.1 6-phosphogluconolactonase [Pseudaminobacter manganicus]
MARKQLTMAEPYNWKEFTDRTTLERSLADTIVNRLASSITKRGKALIAVSGGNTPKKLFQVLSNADLAWDRVIVTLVDERFVPPSSPRSNAALVSENLLQNKAAAARFVPLYKDATSLEDAASSDSVDMQTLPWPADVVILGMGLDGHTASFFPDAGNLASLLDSASTRTVLPVHAQSAGEPRLTLSAARILCAGFLALHIEGSEKRAAFEQAMTNEPKKPIRSVIEAAPKPVEVFWAP